MPDTTYQPKVYRKQGGDEQVVASGGTITVESGGQIDASSGTLKLPSNTLRKGFISIPLSALREIATNDIPANAATPPGGILTKDTTPNFERENGATDPALRLEWAASNVDAVTFNFTYPPDLDDSADLSVHLMARMAASADTPTFTVGYYEGVGDTDAGGATGALSSTLAEVSRTIAAADIGAHPKCATVVLTPGAHGTDALYLSGIWIEYTRVSS